MTRMPQHNDIGPCDVLCGRDKLAFNNAGNRRMRVSVAMVLPKYLEAENRNEKSLLIKSVVSSIHDCGGRFLKYCPKTRSYLELSEKKAHEKCSHAFRDMVSARISTSSGGEKPKSLRRALIPFEVTLIKNLKDDHEYGGDEHRMGEVAEEARTSTTSSSALPPSSSSITRANEPLRRSKRSKRPEEVQEAAKLALDHDQSGQYEPIPFNDADTISECESKLMEDREMLQQYEILSGWSCDKEQVDEDGALLMEINDMEQV